MDGGHHGSSKFGNHCYTGCKLWVFFSIHCCNEKMHQCFLGRSVVEYCLADHRVSVMHPQLNICVSRCVLLSPLSPLHPSPALLFILLIDTTWENGMSSNAESLVIFL